MSSNLTFAPMIRGLKEFKKNQDRIVIDLTKEQADFIATLNTEQMLSGEYNTGEQIEPPYSIRTVQIKAEKHQITDHVTLRDEGNFYYGTKPKFQKDKFTLSSSDKKTKKLVAKYGEEIFGLQDESLDKLKEKILPGLQKKFSEALGI